MDCHYSLSPLLPIRYRSPQVLCVASRILTELLCVGLRRPTVLVCPCIGAHRSTSLTSSSSLLQQCQPCLVRFSLMVCVIVGRCPYIYFFVGCCLQDLFRAARSILVQLPSSLFCRRLVNVHVVLPYSSTDMATAWKNSLFSLSVRSDFHMVDNLSMAVQAFPIRALILCSVDDISLPRYVKLSTTFRCLPSSVEIFGFEEN